MYTHAQQQKHIRLALSALLFVFTLAAGAQPAVVKKAAKSVFTLTTFKADGSLLESGRGVFVGNDGEAISNLKPFIGASKAVVVDANGQKMEVSRIIGLNDIYDVARFRVNGHTTPLPIANVGATAGQDAWLVTYGTKAAEIKAAKVKSVEKFMDKYNFYIFSMNAPGNAAGCPFINMYGQVIGLMQISNTGLDTHACDAAYARSLSADGFSLNDATFRQINIPIAMPANETQARLMLMMAGQSNDSLKYHAAIDDFIRQFPTAADGYNARALSAAAGGQWSLAEQAMQEGIKRAAAKDEAHYNYARMMYDHATAGRHWTLDQAYAEAEAAYKAEKQPIYKHLQAQIIFAKGDYAGALDIFRQLEKDNSLNPGELIYEQAQCKRNLNASSDEVIALLDSAINITDTMRIIEAAPYFLSRAEVLDGTGKYRDAVFDYTRYEYLMQGRVGAPFYYTRARAEQNGKLYQQAINDMARAIIINPREPLYYAELANMQLRVNQFDKAQTTAERCIEVAPEYADGYLLLGLAQIQQKHKAEGLSNLEKAKTLGNEQAQALINKYK